MWRPRPTALLGGQGHGRRPLPDPTTLVDIVAAWRACIRAEDALRYAVVRARKAGQPWSAVGTVLDTTRQAAQQRFAALVEQHAELPEQEKPIVFP